MIFHSWGTCEPLLRTHRPFHPPPILLIFFCTILGKLKALQSPTTPPFGKSHFPSRTTHEATHLEPVCTTEKRRVSHPIITVRLTDWMRVFCTRSPFAGSENYVGLFRIAFFPIKTITIGCGGDGGRKPRGKTINLTSTENNKTLRGNKWFDSALISCLILPRALLKELSYC